MVAAPSIDILNSALAPVEELRGQFEASLRESFAELDALYDELTEWQRDLTREQAELDQRAAAVADAEARTSIDPGELADAQQQLVLAQEYSRQLEEENADQLQTLEDLERQLVAAQAELRTVRKHADELTVALETERVRAVDEHRLWSGELRDMRRMMELQAGMLESLGGKPAVDEGRDDAADADEAHASDDAGEAPAALNDAAARAAEFRRRATSRRAHRRSN